MQKNKNKNKKFNKLYKTFMSILMNIFTIKLDIILCVIYYFQAKVGATYVTIIGYRFNKCNVHLC